MADSAVSYVIQKLVDRLLHEAHLLQEFGGRFKGLQVELKRMQCFLKDADTEQDHERVRNSVSEIRDVSYDVEDLIDTFSLKVKYRNRRGFVKRYASIFKYWSDIYKIGKDIESIQDRIQDITRSRYTYDIGNIREGMSSASSELRGLRRSSHRGSGKDIVGFEKDTAKLVERLVKNDDRSSVISIVGMGGLGKTTLAKKVYNHSDVSVHFPSRAWVYVSQDCRTRDILQEILRQITSRGIEELQNRRVEELEEILYQDLETKRFLVVLDDIWNKQAWDCLARAFPFPLSNGSRLLLTTRNTEVALHADARSIPHELQRLNKEDSWDLFCRKALIFMDGTVDTSCPLGLEDVGRKIVAKCDGLPLAIILIGGLLSRRNQLPSEWESVLGNLRDHFAKDKDGASAILDLSYNDLPYYLKSCFLYVAHFPEDYVIEVRQLLQLWMAEGLIPQGERMESIAKDYLNELIHRNMFQAVKLSVGGRVKECRIHDLLRELCIIKAKEEIFLEIYGNRDLSRQDKTRHLAVHSGGSMFLKSPPSTPRLRSLIVFNFAPNFNPSIEIEIICTSFQLLRVLDLENGRMECLPREIGKLVNLGYLRLRNTGIRVFPLSMRYLQSLQTLDIGDVEFTEIPNVIGKLENLRHLLMNPLCIVGQFKIDTLRHLQTLSYINVLNWKGNNSKLLSNMWKLSVVADKDCTDDDFREFFNSIADLEKLSSLHLYIIHNESRTDYNQFPSLTRGLFSLHRLTKLRIDGSLQRSMHKFPQNLFQLTLNGSLLHQIEMQVLGNLPKLSILRLRDCTADQNQLIFFANGFPQLNFLVLDSLINLEELKVEEGAMPRLQRLRISYCLRLISFRGRFVSNLQELELDDMPQSVEDLFREMDSSEVSRKLPIIFTNTGGHKRQVRNYSLE